jgi:NADPH-dependent curcumin reductase CurA
MGETHSHQIVLVSRPEGRVRLENFRLEKVVLPATPVGQLLL